MHQKKSEVQIGKESSGVSSDFNPTPPIPFPPPSIHQKHPQQSQNFHLTPLLLPASPSSSSSPPSSNLFYSSDSNPNPPVKILISPRESQYDSIAPSPSSTPKTTTHRRPLVTQSATNHPSSNSLTKTTSLSCSLHHYPLPTSPQLKRHHFSYKVPSPSSAKTAAFHLFHRLRHLRCLRVHLRLVLLLALPFLYFLYSLPSRSFLLDFLSAFAFSAALLFSLNLALPRLPSIRLRLARSLLVKLSLSTKVSTPSLPVFWPIGSRQKTEKRLNSGCWVQAYSNEDVYEGEFHKGKCSGSGVYYYHMNGRYEGNWVDGKYDGFGVETWARGSRYRGQYRQGLRQGFGLYRFYTGDVYAGEWSNGQSHGCGVHTCEDGSRYIGEFKCGVKHGHGHYHYRNGDTYAGEYFAGKMHGFGVYRFANGHVYEGAWHEGRRQGLGIYIFRSGVTQSGHWQNGILDIPITQNTTYPLTPVAVYHSKVLNVVQEARRAAEKAYDVLKVDERVNRAVSAANRAANAARVAAVKAVLKKMLQKRNSDGIPIDIV